MIQTDAVLDVARLRAFAAEHYGEQPTRLALRVCPLRGGLESCAVARVEVTSGSRERSGRHFVVKCVAAPHRREIEAYQMLARANLQIAPRLLGAEDIGCDTTYLYLEWIDSCRTWPWSDTALAARALEQLAHLHMAITAQTEPWLKQWDYEMELRRSAESTLEAFEAAARGGELGIARRRRRALERIVNALPAIRRQLLAQTVVLHGDAHSANTALRLREGLHEAVLFDWSRVRLGSPLEDVSSWLQSLGYWEWEAHRRHDTLLRLYLESRGLPPVLSTEFRESYWLAGASNALAGALRYHLSFLNDDWPYHLRAEHAKAARDWLRIIRRADACWCA